MTNTTEGRTLITRNEAAGLAGVTTRTICRWAAAGHIATYKTRVGHVRHDKAEIEAMGVAVPVSPGQVDGQLSFDDTEEPEPEHDTPTLRERMMAVQTPRPRQF